MTTRRDILGYAAFAAASVGLGGRALAAAKGGLKAGAARPGKPTKVRFLAKGADMGAAHGINLGTIDAFKRGILRSADVIVPGAWFPEAVKMLNDNKEISVGVHLALNSEWETVKWRPLTRPKTIVDEMGYFFPMATAGQWGYPPEKALLAREVDYEEVARELRAQVDLCRKHLPQTCFVSAHMRTAMSTPELKAVTQRLSQEVGLPIQDDTPGTQVSKIWKVEDDADTRAEKFAAFLAALKPGTYWMYEHASTDDPEMRALWHHNYEGVARDRADTVKTWTDKRVLDVIEKHGIELVNHQQVFAEAGMLPHAG